MKCTNCGKEIDEDSLFCEYCGTKIVQEKSVDMDAIYKTVPLLDKENAMWLGVCAGMARYRVARKGGNPRVWTSILRICFILQLIPFQYLINYSMFKKNEQIICG